MEIGTIKNITNFLNLNDTDLNGGWSISSGKLIGPANNTTPIQFKYVSGLWKSKRTIVCNKSTMRLFINNTAGNFTGQFFVNESGNLCSYFSYDNTTKVSQDILNFSEGDLFEYILDRNGWAVTFSIRNLTTNQIVTLNADNVIISIHKLRLVTYEATEVTSFKLESSQEKGKTIVVGDSITYGSDANSSTTSWVGVANLDRVCGPGDRSADALLLIEEIFNIVKPRRVIYAMGTNDPNINVWINAITVYKQQCVSSKITFIPITPYANNVNDLTSFSNYITANFQHYFDIFSITKKESNSQLKTEYDSGDGVHPNQVGHTAIGNYVLNNPNYNYYQSFGGTKSDDVFIFYRKNL